MIEDSSVILTGNEGLTSNSAVLVLSGDESESYTIEG